MLKARIFLRFRSNEKNVIVFVEFNHETSMFDCFLKSATFSTKLPSVVYSILQLNECNKMTLFKMNQTPQLFDEDEAVFECDYGPQNGKQIGIEIDFSSSDMYKWCTMLRDMHIHNVDGSYPVASSPNVSPIVSASYVSPLSSESSSREHSTYSLDYVDNLRMLVPIPKLRRSNAERESADSLLAHDLVI
jgi:hypothetical protein